LLRWSSRLEFIPSSQVFATQSYIFVAAADHSRVYKLNVAKRGEVVEFYRTEIDQVENHVTSRPVYVDPVLHFASHDGRIYVYSGKEGKRGHPFQTGGAILADPVVHSYVRPVLEKEEKDGKETVRVKDVETKTVLVGSMDNAFYSLDASSGQLLWKYECGGPIKSAAVAKDKTVYVRSEDGALFALNTVPVHAASAPNEPLQWKRNGELRWKIPLAERFLFKGRGSVYVLGPKKEIYAVQEFTGDLVGRYKTRYLQFLVTNTADDFFYCANAGGTIFALKESKENY
jgi:outer membrane protein assembly factor BamB